MDINTVSQKISNHPSNIKLTKKGYKPLFTASATASLVIIGHAPGIRAQESGIHWGDKSGDTLKSWLGLDDETFRDDSKIALIPMDFYYPGKGKTGDNPPRKEFAPMWHPKLFAHMNNVKLTLLVGQYAQKYYLQKTMKKNLTETVKSYEDYLPTYFPLVHPSPLNFRWQAKNPWFVETVVPKLQKEVNRILT